MPMGITGRGSYAFLATSMRALVLVAFRATARPRATSARRFTPTPIGTWDPEKDRLGISFGSNLDTAGNQAFALGWSLFYGDGDAGFTFGLLLKQVNQLRFNAVGDIFDSTAIDTRRVWRSALFVGFSFEGLGRKAGEN